MRLIFKHSALISAKNVLKYKEYHTKVLLNGFNINGCTLGFFCSAKNVLKYKEYHTKVLLNGFNINGCTLGFFCSGACTLKFHAN